MELDGSIPWGTQWELVRSADEAVAWGDFLVTLGFQDGRAGGKAPVNRYFGMCAVDAETGRVSLGPFGMTMMAGPPAAMDAEMVFMALLEQAVEVRAEGEHLLLTDADGAALLEFAPAADPL